MEMLSLCACKIGDDLHISLNRYGGLSAVDRVVLLCNSASSNFLVWFTSVCGLNK